MPSTRTRPRIALLDASHADSNTRRNFRRELDAELVEYDVTSNITPPHVEFDGIVITGSRSSVYWDEPWIQTLITYVTEAIQKQLPVLGVCYGHQVLASAIGGTVSDMGEYELGYREITQRATDPLFEGIPDSFMAFTSHSDVDTDLPDEAVTLAHNDYGIHAFRYGNAWGVQFHPEYDRQTAEVITRRKSLPDAYVQEVLDEITEANYSRACKSKRLFDNFLGEIEHSPQSISTVSTDVV